MVYLDSPTGRIYAALEMAYNHFNRELFDNQLPPCLITLRSSSRHHGYHHEERFVSIEETFVSELGINPGFFMISPIESVLSTLVHEMVHQWQLTFGSPPKDPGHNKEWANKMEDIGLMPSKTGLPGGGRTGKNVNDYIIEGGLFMAACKKLLDTGFKLPFMDRHITHTAESEKILIEELRDAGEPYQVSIPFVDQLPENINGKPTVIAPKIKSKAPQKIKLSCPQCMTKAWVIENTGIICTACKVNYEPS